MNVLKKIKVISLTISLICLLVCISSVSFSEDLVPSAKAEWDNAKVIIMQPPSIADFWISILPKANGYDTPFDYLAARQELLNYIEILNSSGITIYKIEEVLLDGTIGENGNPIQGAKLNKLQDFANKFLEVRLINRIDELNNSDKEKLELYKNKTIKSLPPEDLVKLILQNPILTVRKDPKSISGFYCEYALDPAIDLFYLRDQIVTTGKGIVIGKFAHRVSNETKIVKFVLDKLGITPIYEITGSGTLEGGDFFMADDTVFIGESLRTNPEGIKQLMDNNVIGTNKVVVVKDNLLEPAQMHLDTYFNTPAPNLAVLSVERMRKKDGGVDDSLASAVDVYELQNGKYVQTVKDRDFKEYLENDLQYKVIHVSIKDQRALATNFLTIAPYTIIGPEGASREFKDALKKEGITAIWVDMTNIVRGFGAARCTTQPICRGN